MGKTCAQVSGFNELIKDDGSPYATERQVSM